MLFRSSYVERRRTDLLSATTIRLIAWLQVRDIGTLEDEVFTNLANFGQALPSSDSHNLINRLCDDNARTAKVGLRLTTNLDGTPRTDETIVAFRTKMREIIMSNRTNMGIA